MQLTVPRTLALPLTAELRAGLALHLTAEIRLSVVPGNEAEWTLLGAMAGTDPA